jgi:hypothetical protein
MRVGWEKWRYPATSPSSKPSCAPLFDHNWILVYIGHSQVPYNTARLRVQVALR